MPRSRIETEVINPRTPEKPVGAVIKDYLDRRHTQGWELVHSIQLFEDILFVWRRPDRETRTETR